MTLLAREGGIPHIVVPKDNGSEGSVVKGVGVYGVSHLLDLVHFLRETLGDRIISTHEGLQEGHSPEDLLNFSDIKGQAQAKRALEICWQAALITCS